jgi:hypothetical protein
VPPRMRRCGRESARRMNGCPAIQSVLICSQSLSFSVMAGLVPAIHVFRTA